MTKLSLAKLPTAKEAKSSSSRDTPHATPQPTPQSTPISSRALAQWIVGQALGRSGPVRLELRRVDDAAEPDQVELELSASRPLFRPRAVATDPTDEDR